MTKLEIMVNLTTFLTGMTLFFVIFLIAIKKYLNQKNEVDHERRKK